MQNKVSTLQSKPLGASIYQKQFFAFALFLLTTAPTHAAICPMSVSPEPLPIIDTNPLNILTELRDITSPFRSGDTTKRFQGSYRVPVAEDRQDLLELSQFEVEYKFTYKQGVLNKISYDLPELLTGAANDVDLAPKGVDDQGRQIWSGANSTGKCEQNDTSFECVLLYQNLSVQKDQAIALIEAKTIDPIERTNRISVMETFITEPCGIIHVNDIE